ncbi:hypothetical protein JW710_00095 [Candidatus Dojkabacteria bacterium]|nr:hypothetical protein [Candidatus Dojkabacteria bacterium]
MSGDSLYSSGVSAEKYSGNLDRGDSTSSVSSEESEEGYEALVAGNVDQQRVAAMTRLHEGFVSQLEALDELLVDPFAEIVSRGMFREPFDAMMANFRGRQLSCIQFLAREGVTLENLAQIVLGGVLVHESKAYSREEDVLSMIGENFLTQMSGLYGSSKAEIPGDLETDVFLIGGGAALGVILDIPEPTGRADMESIEYLVNTFGIRIFNDEGEEIPMEEDGEMTLEQAQTVWRTLQSWRSLTVDRSMLPTEFKETFPGDVVVFFGYPDEQSVRHESEEVFHHYLRDQMVSYLKEQESTALVPDVSYTPRTISEIVGMTDEDCLRLYGRGRREVIEGIRDADRSVLAWSIAAPALSEISSILSEDEELVELEGVRFIEQLASRSIGSLGILPGSERMAAINGLSKEDIAKILEAYVEAYTLVRAVRGKVCELLQEKNPREVANLLHAYFGNPVNFLLHGEREELGRADGSDSYSRFEAQRRRNLDALTTSLAVLKRDQIPEEGPEVVRGVLGLEDFSEGEDEGAKPEQYYVDTRFESRFIQDKGTIPACGAVVEFDLIPSHGTTVAITIGEAGAGGGMSSSRKAALAAEVSGAPAGFRRYVILGKGDRRTDIYMDTDGQVVRYYRSNAGAADQSLSELEFQQACSTHPESNMFFLKEATVALPGGEAFAQSLIDLSDLPFTFVPKSVFERLDAEGRTELLDKNIFQLSIAVQRLLQNLDIHNASSFLDNRFTIGRVELSLQEYIRRIVVSAYRADYSRATRYFGTASNGLAQRLHIRSADLDQYSSVVYDGASEEPFAVLRNANQSLVDGVEQFVLQVLEPELQAAIRRASREAAVGRVVAGTGMAESVVPVAASTLNHVGLGDKGGSRRILVTLFPWIENMVGDLADFRDQLKASPSRDQLLKIGLSLCNALGGVAHEGLNVVHRDVKPQNVLIVGSNMEKVLLGDFGISVHKGSTMTVSDLDSSSSAGRTALMGTPGYVAPEVLPNVLQLKGETSLVVTEAVDAYGLGATLFAVAVGCVVDEAGDPPIPGVINVMTSDHSDQVEEARRAAIRSNLASTPMDPQMIEIVVRLLEIDPGERQTNLLAVAEELRRISNPFEDLGLMDGASLSDLDRAQSLDEVILFLRMSVLPSTERTKALSEIASGLDEVSRYAAARRVGVEQGLAEMDRILVRAVTNGNRRTVRNDLSSATGAYLASVSLGSRFDQFYASAVAIFTRVSGQLRKLQLEGRLTDPLINTLQSIFGRFAREDRRIINVGEFMTKRGLEDRMGYLHSSREGRFFVDDESLAGMCVSLQSEFKANRHLFLSEVVVRLTSLQGEVDFSSWRNNVLSGDQYASSNLTRHRDLGRVISDIVVSPARREELEKDLSKVVEELRSAVPDDAYRLTEVLRNLVAVYVWVSGHGMQRQLSYEARDLRDYADREHEKGYGAMYLSKGITEVSDPFYKRFSWLRTLPELRNRLLSESGDQGVEDIVRRAFSDAVGGVSGEIIDYWNEWRNAVAEYLSKSLSRKRINEILYQRDERAQLRRIVGSISREIDDFNKEHRRILRDLTS